MKYLNEKQVAEITGLSVKTLQRWRLFGEGPEFKKFGGAVRYPCDALESWIARAPRGGDAPMPVNQKTKSVEVVERREMPIGPFVGLDRKVD